MARYAATTSVSPEKSQTEIKTILRRYGADRFGIMEDDAHGYVMFEFKGLMIQMKVAMPDKDSEEFRFTETGRERSADAMLKDYEQSIKQRWRALLLAIKAKLEAVETGISTIEQEFMAFVVMPDGHQLGEHIIPQLEQIVKTGRMPKLLQLGMGGKE